MNSDVPKKGIPGGPHLKRDTLKQLKLCLDAAVREQIIRTNPAAEVKPPPVPRKVLPTTDVLEADELARLAVAMPERWRTFTFISGWLGWRWSEAMGLRVCDVDLVTGELHLGRHVAVEVGGRVLVRAGGKTAAATRTIPLPSAALDALRPVVEDRFRTAGPDAPVWVTAAGTTPLRGNMSRMFQKAVTEAGLAGRGLNVRQLRHTSASRMLAAGLDVLDVQNRLGHSDAATTLMIYSRVLTSRRMAGTELMDAAMGAVRGGLA